MATKKSSINCTASHKHGKPAACTVLLFTISVLCSVVHFTVRPQTHSESCVEITNMTFQLIHLAPWPPTRCRRRPSCIQEACLDSNGGCGDGKGIAAWPHRIATTFIKVGKSKLVTSALKNSTYQRHHVVDWTNFFSPPVLLYQL